jgi:ergothioneine biosynthesis protein EgtB
MQQATQTIAAATPAHQSDERERLLAGFREVRGRSQILAEPLSPEDMTAQSMADASPAKWHLAHTTWFFETFILRDYRPGYRAFHPAYNFLFNSYYESVGERHARPRRGLLTRPSAAEVLDYRRHVDTALEALVIEAPVDAWLQLAPLLELGLHHEMQHQELLLTDVLHLLAQNPLSPAYRDAPLQSGSSAPPLTWWDHDGGLVEIGHDGAGFAYDCEGPRHSVFLQPFALASRPVSNGDWLAFMADGGYENANLWLSDAWATVQSEGWRAPLYWEEEAADGLWTAMTLLGRRQVDPQAPVCHVSLFEADAYARWAGARLPKEAELEVAVAGLPVAGNLLGSDVLMPQAGTGTVDRPDQLYGDVWEWTQSAYGPYPGFRAPEGAVGEYNGKFMCSQFVLRGGSCVTPDAQLRPSYRNFFYPHQRWQFTGLRLAKDRS